MAMKVPINPQTRVPQGQLGYERPVDVTAGTRMLAQVVDKYAQSTAQDQKKRELFDVHRLLVDETNNIQTDFDDKTRIEPLGAPNFTQRVNGEYNTRHQQMVEDLKARGYSDDAVQEFSTRLGTIRSQYVARAIDFQDKSNFSKVKGDADQLVIGLSQYAGKNPNALGSTLDEFRVALTHTGLDQIEQEQLYEAGKGTIRKAAQEGFAIQHPDVVIQAFDPQHPITTIANSPDGSATTITTQSVKPSGQLADNIVAGLKNRGLTDAQARGVAAGIAAESANKTTAFNAEGGGQGAFGLGQWRGPRQKALFAKYGRNPTGSQQLDFLVAELRGGDAGGKAVLSQADEVAVLHSYVNDFMRPSAAGAKGDISRGLAALGKKVSEHAERTIAALKPIPKGWKGNQEDAIQELDMTADQAAEFLKTGRDTRVPGQPNTGGLGPTSVQAFQDTGIQFDEQAQTGIGVLDLSSGPERIQMLTLARTIMNGREADAKAAASAQHEAFLNTFLNDLQDGKKGQADLDAAYAGGQITDFDERRKAQGILDAKNKKNDDLARFHAMLSSGQKFNPYDDDAQKAVDAGFDNAVKYSAEHGNFANPFVIALRAWQRTGILPKQGGVMLRGGLIGTDPQTVAASASVASNMLKQNPNAFAGVEGGDEIGKAATTYTHYVDDLGMSADEAAQKIALQNSPEFQTKLKANEVERNTLISSITGDKSHPALDVEKVINDAILGPKGWGYTLVNLGTFGHANAFLPRGSFGNEQKAEARQTYMELALDYYDKNHDVGAAQAYASRQMSRFYGVEGGRILKYPATKAYPEINGSREYVFDQVKTLVDETTGLKVPKENIFLQPTSSGSTAAAFRAGKAPPYEVHYFTEVDGQRVYHYIPGKVFIADVEEARRAAEKVAREEVMRRRRTIVLPGIGPIETAGPE